MCGIRSQHPVVTRCVFFPLYPSSVIRNSFPDTVAYTSVKSVICPNHVISVSSHLIVYVLFTQILLLHDMSLFIETLQLHWRVSCLYVPICYSIDLSDSAMLMRRRRKYITKSTIAANSTVSNSEYTTLIGAMRTSKAIMSTLICDMT